MAFLPEKNYFEEDIISSYDLSTGSNNFTSSDISKFINFSLHFILDSSSGSNTFKLEQSNDGVNWSDLNGEVELPSGSTNFIIDKAFFSGKYVRINFITNDSGIVNCKLIAKR